MADTFLDYAARVGALIKGRSPVGHKHPTTDVTGLAARLAALEYTTGLRSLPLPAGITGGTARCIRTGPVATVAVNNLRGIAEPFSLGTLPPGMRPLQSLSIPMEAGGGSLSVSASGEVSIEGQSSDTIWMRAQVTYQVDSPDVRPSPPFSPA